MKTITAKEFEKSVAENPDWAMSLTEPIGIEGYVQLHGSPIRHLSKLLHFLQPNISADFFSCTDLKIAEGTFEGFVGFNSSGIEKIGDLNIVGTHEDGDCASFAHCKNLKVAEGDFPGYVSFEHTGVVEIGNLIIGANKAGIAASFQKCGIKIARGTFHGGVLFSNALVEKIDRQKLIISKGKTSFKNCAQLKVAEGIFPEFVDFTNSGVRRIGKLELGGANKTGPSASFWGCNDLKECRPEHLENEKIIMIPDKRAELTKRIKQAEAARIAMKTQTPHFL